MAISIISSICESHRYLIVIARSNLSAKSMSNLFFFSIFILFSIVLNKFYSCILWHCPLSLNLYDFKIHAGHYLFAKFYLLPNLYEKKDIPTFINKSCHNNDIWTIKKRNECPIDQKKKTTKKKKNFQHICVIWHTVVQLCRFIGLV